MKKDYLNVVSSFMDKLTKEQRRRNMQAVKSTGSKIEIALAHALFRRGYRYRKNNAKILGKPDLTLSRFKVAIFVDSEFWHGKNWSTKKYAHKSNIDFWHKKIEKNIQRDKYVNKTLKKEGWLVLRFWGKQIQKNVNLCADRVEAAILKRSNFHE